MGSSQVGVHGLRRWPLHAAAGLTVAAAVVSDTALGERPVHTALLAAVAVLVGVVRVRLAGRHQGLVAVMGAAVVAQPGVHAASKLVHLLGDSDDHHHLGADVSTALAHLVLALALVVGVCTVEQVLHLVARTLHRWVWLLRTPPPAVSDEPAPSAADTPPSVPVHRLWVRHIGRRGPPVARLAVA